MASRHGLKKSKKNKQKTIALVAQLVDRESENPSLDDELLASKSHPLSMRIYQLQVMTFKLKYVLTTILNIS